MIACSIDWVSSPVLVSSVAHSFLGPTSIPTTLTRVQPSAFHSPHLTHDSAHRPALGPVAVGFSLFFCDFQEENAEIVPFFVHFD